jgi:hypothetical protein
VAHLAREQKLWIFPIVHVRNFKLAFRMIVTLANRSSKHIPKCSFFSTAEDWPLGNTFGVVGEIHSELSLEDRRLVGMTISRRPNKRESIENAPGPRHATPSPIAHERTVVAWVSAKFGHDPFTEKTTAATMAMTAAMPELRVR